VRLLARVRPRDGGRYSPRQRAARQQQPSRRAQPAALGSLRTGIARQAIANDCARVRRPTPAGQWPSQCVALRSAIPVGRRAGPAPDWANGRLGPARGDGAGLGLSFREARGARRGGELVGARIRPMRDRPRHRAADALNDSFPRAFRSGAAVRRAPEGRMRATEVAGRCGERGHSAATRARRAAASAADASRRSMPRRAAWAGDLGSFW
jgi:hypothetical protein